MKYFTGDESGLIKCNVLANIKQKFVKKIPNIHLTQITGISFPPKVEENHRHKKAKKVEGSEEKEKKEALQPLTGTFGKVDKENAVQKLSWAMWEEAKVVGFLLRYI